MSICLSGEAVSPSSIHAQILYKIRRGVKISQIMLRSREKYFVFV